MATTASVIKNNLNHSRFGWFKIHGLPYYFFVGMDPTASTWGSAAWTLGTGYSKVLGMKWPGGSGSQDLPDLVGGVASGERLNISILDEQLGDSGGKYRRFGKLLVPGRLRSGAAKWGYLNADLDPAVGVGGSMYLRGPQGFAASGYLYCGSETIAYDARTEDVSPGVTGFEISGRNKFAAVDNWNSKTWPVQPFYPVRKDAGGTVVASEAVVWASEPASLLGRPCAFFLGHRERPDGPPCAEADGVLRWVGRIVDADRDGVTCEMHADGLLDEIQGTRIAPFLASATIEPHQLIVANHIRARTFLLGIGRHDKTGYMTQTEWVVTIAAGTYLPGVGPGGILTAINAAIKTAIEAAYSYASLRPTVHAVMRYVKDEVRVVFTFEPGMKMGSKSYLDGALSFYVRHGVRWNTAGVLLDNDKRDDIETSLLSALGFPPSLNAFEAEQADATGGAVGVDPSMPRQRVTAPGPAPWIFVPTNASGSTTVRTLGVESDRFFTDQGDGSGRAFVRFGNGQIVALASAATSSLVIGALPGANLFPGIGAVYSPAADLPYPQTYYAVPYGEAGEVEQVLAAPGIGRPQDSPATVIGRLLASDGAATAQDDLNMYPRGIGLRMRSLLDAPAFRQSSITFGARRFIIDKETTVGDLFTPLAKEYGWFLVWDPEEGEITLRKLRVPGPGVASGYTLDESNRGTLERSRERVDRKHMRTGWIVKTGWSERDKKFVNAPIVVNDYAAQAGYGASAKTVEIADKSLLAGVNVGILLEQAMRARAAFYKAPWTRLRRAIDKRLGLLSPGLVVALVDTHATNAGGYEGIATADAIYGVIAGVDAPPDGSRGSVDVYVNNQDAGTRVNKLAPTGLIDFDKNDGGFTNGYNPGTKQLAMARWFTENEDGSTYDGIDFAATQVIRVTTRDNAGAPGYNFSDTISAIDATGRYVTLTGGIAGLSASVESILIFAVYSGATAAQQGAVAFQADGTSSEIDGSAVPHVWT